MKYNLLAATFLALAMNSCENKKPGENFFSFNDSNFKTLYKNGDAVALEVLNAQQKKIDSIAFYANDKRVASVKGNGKAGYLLKDAKFGYQNLKAVVFYEGESEEISGRVEVVSSIEPKLLRYAIVNVFPHDTTTFTEGLEFYRDTLLESSGQNGNSYVRKIDYKTGKVYKQADLEQQYFGEGITVLDNKIYFLTYRSNVGFIYNADTFKREKTFSYDKKIEGWGMTNDGTHIYQSDGTEKIWTMDPATQKMKDFVNVYSTSGKIKSVNELEYLNGKIYGNIWQKDAIALIDPKTGAVEGILNLVDLRKQLKNPASEVLNGIAYNPRTKTLFVTGKNWDKLFEIKVAE